jgi:phosphatidylserine/phosphatidylglycerophosphate/cardiolipin synthase-like enzyme
MNEKRLTALLALFLILVTATPLFGVVETEAPNFTQGYSITQDIEWQTFSKNMNVTTFVSPDGSKDELWHFLNSAEESIYVEIYGINNPYILDLIHELHDTKPSLEMKFLLGWNSLGYYSENDYVANNLTQLGYEVKWTNPDDFNFAHQKFVIIDNETTIVHAGNWAKTSFPEEGDKANREWSLAMTDTDVTGYYREVLDKDWAAGVEYDSGEHGTGDPLTYTGAGTTYARPFAEAGEFSGDMNVTPVFSPETSLQAILYLINSAQATLDIQIPYFTSVGDEGAVDEIIDAIIAAKNRGVTVRIITEDVKDWEEIEAIFSEHNIPVVWHDTRWFSANHNKGIIVDGRMVLISSINYSDGSITENREAGVIIENEDVAQYYQEIYDFDWGIGDCDVMDEVNIYWTPNIPTSGSEINVTLYAHMLNETPVDEVYLDYRIGDGAWNNISIIDTLHLSAEEDPENYYHIIPAQSDGTNITVVGRVKVGSTWHVGMPMVIRVRDSIGSVITSPTTSPTTTTETIDPLMQLLIDYAIYIAIAIVAAIIGAVFYKKRR